MELTDIDVAARRENSPRLFKSALSMSTVLAVSDEELANILTIPQTQLQAYVGCLENGKPFVLSAEQLWRSLALKRIWAVMEVTFADVETARHWWIGISRGPVGRGRSPLQWCLSSDEELSAYLDRLEQWATSPMRGGLITRLPLRLAVK